ncbi:MAG: zinc-ribbon domain-containing protein [Deltaproteobacteria bacterium]|nr:zinc-ribbon domain-containing protein [Deltaproteobacteria bacterium]
MIELHCPSCHQKLKITKAPPTKVQASWVKCPKCGEVFKSLRLDLNSITSDAPETKLKISPNIYKNQYREKETNYASGYGYPLNVTRSGLSSVFKVGFFGFIAVILVAFMGWLFRASAPAFIKAEKDLQPLVNYAENQVVQDLRAIKRDLGMFSRADRLVSFQGYESRIYAYFQEKLAPTACADIVELAVASENTNHGFTLTGVCQGQGLAPAELSFSYQGPNVKVEEAKTSEYLEISLENQK